MKIKDITYLRRIIKEDTIDILYDRGGNLYKCLEVDVDVYFIPGEIHCVLRCLSKLKFPLKRVFY